MVINLGLCREEVIGGHSVVSDVYDRIRWEGNIIARVENVSCQLDDMGK